MSFVSVATTDNVAVIRIDRPKVNALSIEVLDDLSATFAELTSARPRAVLLWGGPTVFSGGADIDELTSPDNAREVAQAFRRTTRLIETFPRVVVAAIAGYALGGGLEVALAADFRLAESSSKLGTPEIKLGLLPGGGANARLPQLIGEARARELLLTGENISAETAHAYGLVNRVVEMGAIYEEGMAFAKTFAEGAPLAQAHIKEVLREGRTFGVDHALNSEETAFIEILRSHDASEGLRSFRERDPSGPAFIGE